MLQHPRMSLLEALSARRRLAGGRRPAHIALALHILGSVLDHLASRRRGHGSKVIAFNLAGQRFYTCTMIQLGSQADRHHDTCAEVLNKRALAPAGAGGRPRSAGRTLWPLVHCLRRPPRVLTPIVSHRSEFERAKILPADVTIHAVALVDDRKAGLA
jgi:hypothetical protein